MITDRGTLDQSLLAAHARGDARELVTLYAQAASASSGAASAFYLTHAYVFALETGDQSADALRLKLVEIGSEPACA